jgi:hypothetical protein
VLVDHPDSGGYRLRGFSEVHCGAVNTDDTTVWLNHPVSDSHQGRLSRPVLAEESVNGPATNHDLGVFEGGYCTESL